ncbi:1-phosphofructokinase family hexose kinase [Candidatus Hydrogenedentota bacterium]
MILTVTLSPCVDKTYYTGIWEPGDTVRAHKSIDMAAGKGVNVARVVNTLGGKARAFVVTGGRTGEYIRDMLETEEEFETVFCQVSGNSRVISTVLDETTGKFTTFVEPGPKLSSEEQGAVVESAVAAMDGCTSVALSGPAPDDTSAGMARLILTEAKKRSLKTVLDSRGATLIEGLKAKPDMTKPNVAEAEELLGVTLSTEKDYLAAINAYHERGVGIVVLSLGEKGAVVSDGDAILRASPPKVQAVNPTGSGDSMVAACTMGLDKDLGAEEIARRGVAAGTANTTVWKAGGFSSDVYERLFSTIIGESMEPKGN